MAARVPTPLVVLIGLLLACVGGKEEASWLHAKEAAYLSRGSEDKFASDKPSAFVSSLAAQASKLASADAAFIDGKEFDASFATEAADQPSEWLTALAATANELAAADVNFVDVKQAAASKAKVEAKKVVDPTKGMSLKEKKDYYEKALQEVRLEPVALVVRIENHTKIITMSLSQSRTLGKGRAEDCGRRAQNYGKGGGQRGQNCGQKSGDRKQEAHRGGRGEC